MEPFTATYTSRTRAPEKGEQSEPDQVKRVLVLDVNATQSRAVIVDLGGNIQRCRLVELSEIGRLERIKGQAITSIHDFLRR